MNLAEHYSARLAAWSDIQDHLEFLHEAVLGYESPVVIELGVRSGNSTASLLAACQEKKGWLYSADLSTPDVPKEFFAGPWSFRRGDSVSESVLGFMPRRCDVLFIDTSHTFEQTMAELDAYVPRVAAGGLALFHDTRWLPPAISLTTAGGPVTDALDAWCAANERTWTNRHGAENGYGLGIINC